MEEAAGVGLKLVQGSEAMCRLRMRSAAQRGDSRGIVDAFEYATRSAQRLGPWAEVEDETAAVWDEVGRQRDTETA